MYLQYIYGNRLITFQCYREVPLLMLHVLVHWPYIYAVCVDSHVLSAGLQLFTVYKSLVYLCAHHIMLNQLLFLTDPRMEDGTALDLKSNVNCAIKRCWCQLHSFHVSYVVRSICIAQYLHQSRRACIRIYVCMRARTIIV